MLELAVTIAIMGSDDDGVFFEATKEDRGWYFVEYRPPLQGYRFATLQLVVVGPGKGPEDIAQSMDAELVIWLERYPIPIMISAFDDSGNLLPLKEIRGSDHLVGFLDPNSHQVVRKWRLVADEELPADALSPSHLKHIYSDFPLKTRKHLREEAISHAKRTRIGWWIVFVWAAVVPAAVALLEWWSDWLGVAVLLYSLWRALEKALQLMGKWPKSKAEKEEEAEEARMRHHHYHCERNPEGFRRLKAENFERWAREEIQREAKVLRHVIGDESGDG